ncbi:hypothetical protein Megvenef_01201 [Candidatus Megaera venefica]|uniref:Leucine-rich repeat domain-containing protein n=1 Tax=Candidatus Megaera venefica TaxID=2055910 RepID=A0ABU5NDJ0_9RICK|nr:hypothetical protein [Candidatus Megaera venefica]MEA0971228.1 hypothetical protein [Candidatus Megaera venefica]
MKLRKNPGIIAELNQLAENPELDPFTSPEIMASSFYQIMQTTVKLDSSYLANNLTPAAFVLLAKIASTSHTLHTWDMGGNGLYNLDFHSLMALADAITTSPTLHILNIRRNFLGEHIVAFIKSLLKSNIQIIDIRWNCIQEDMKKEAIISLIKDRNQEVLEWKEAFEFLGTVVGPLNTQGECQHNK